MIRRKLEELRWREVVWRRPFEIEAVWELLAHIAAATPRGAVLWEARGQGGHVRYLLGTDSKYSHKMEEIIRSHGDIRLYDAPEHTRKPVREARRLRITKPVLSLKTDVSLAVIRACLAAMSAVKSGEEAVLQIVLGGSFSPSQIPSRMPDPNASWLSASLGNAEQASSESRGSAKEKAGQYSFQAVIRLGVSGQEAVSRIAGIHSALRILESAGVRIHAEPEKASRINLAHIPWHFPLRLSVKELASFLLLPVGETELAGTAGLHPKPLLPPEWYKSPVGISQDRSFAVSEQARLSISPHDSLEHTVLLGPTGSGKSTAIQDNQERSVIMLTRWPSNSCSKIFLDAVSKHR